MTNEKNNPDESKRRDEQIDALQKRTVLLFQANKELYASLGEKEETIKALHDKLVAQEAMFRRSWKWRLGSLFIDGLLLVFNFFRHPLNFFDNPGKYFRQFFEQVMPPPAPKPAVGKESGKDQLAPSRRDLLRPDFVINEDKITIGCVLDEFTAPCFQPECNMITFRPDNWRETLEYYRPAAIFVESAWRGNGGSWQYRVAKYQKNMGDELLHLLAWANGKKIPTFFWNKEDPVHFDRFIEKACFFDHVFTSDADCIPRYREFLGHDRVYPLPFAAQPAIHNPILEQPRRGSVCFAGTYYGDRHAERRSDMEHILKPALDFGLDIYDRQFGLTGAQAELFRFPDIYQPAIKGRLNYDEMVKAYKNYRVFLNVNSVKSSPTMFARRVYELLACGTPVVSTYSRGIVELLGEDIVFITESEADTRKHLEYLLGDDDAWLKASVRGIRKVMSEHTYANRLGYILERLGVGAPASNLPFFTVLARAASGEEIDGLAAMLSAQTYRRFGVVLLSGAALTVAELEKLDKALAGIQAKNIVSSSSELYSQVCGVYESDYFAVIDGQDYYGPNYLMDFALAAMYSGADFLGKGSFSFDRQEKLVREDAGQMFRLVRTVPAATLVFRKDALPAPAFGRCLQSPDFLGEDFLILSIDPYNYCRHASGTGRAAMANQKLRQAIEV